MARNSITMRDIAEKLGVSKNAVYLALNGKSGVSDALRSKVSDMATQLGYGVYAKGQNPCIMLVVPEYLREDAYFYVDIFWAVEAEAKKRGYLTTHTVVGRAEEDALETLKMPTGMSVVGILVVGVFSEAYIEMLCSLGYPMLSVDIHYHGVPVGSVSSSNHSAGVTATRYLIGKGHRRIGFVGPAYTAQSVYERWCGFRQAMETAGLPLRQEWTIIGSPNSFQFFDTTEALLPYIHESMELPGAWFCAGDRIAVAMMNLLATRGVRVPEDVSILGFDDIQLAEMVLPKLTTMHVSRKRMGRLAVEYLLREVDEGSCGMLEICLPCKLIERDSVARTGEYDGGGE